MTPKIAIVRFPGTNRHQEAFNTIKDAGMEPVYVKWNEEKDYIASFDGYLIAGGFSYEDRSRAGVIAALDPVMEVILEQAKKGKAIIGICNGAQMLIETGIVPGTGDTRMCIAESVRQKDGEILGTAFINHWVHLKMVASPKRSAFNFSYNNPDELINCIIAHGEGRYTTRDMNLLNELKKNDQILFKYVTPEGEEDNSYPTNPNGTLDNIAGIINKEGNVMAIMPHPEQYPHLAKQLFESMRDYILAGNTTDNLSASYSEFTSFETPAIEKRETNSIRLHVKLMITDKEEQTINDTLKGLNIDSSIDKYRTMEISLKDSNNWEDKIDTLIKSGEICNLNKESLVVEKDSVFFEYDNSEFTEIDTPFQETTLFVIPIGNYHGESLKKTLNDSNVESLLAGKTWSLTKNVDQVLGSNILFNIHSQTPYYI